MLYVTVFEALSPHSQPPGVSETVSIITMSYPLSPNVRPWLRSRDDTMLMLFFRAVDGDSTFLRNTGIYLRVHTASQPRRPTSTRPNVAGRAVCFFWWLVLSKTTLKSETLKSSRNYDVQQYRWLVCVNQKSQRAMWFRQNPKCGSNWHSDWPRDKLWQCPQLGMKHKV
jgi:hypothetical protein